MTAPADGPTADDHDGGWFRCDYCKAVVIPGRLPHDPLCQRPMTPAEDRETWALPTDYDHTADVDPATCEKREWGIHCPCWTKRVGPCCACGATADVDPAPDDDLLIEALQLAEDLTSIYADQVICGKAADVLEDLAARVRAAQAERDAAHACIRRYQTGWISHSTTGPPVWFRHRAIEPMTPTEADAINHVTRSTDG